MVTKLARTILPAILVLVLGIGPLPARPANGDQQSIAESGPAPLLQQLGQARISYHAATGQVRFIGAAPGHPIARSAGLLASAPPQVSARAFLSSYGRLFGLREQARELRVARVQRDSGGRSTVRFQQVHGGIPVLAGELNVRMDGVGNVLSAGGEVLPSLQLGVAPAVTAAAALRQALGAVAKTYRVRENTLTATRPQLWIYDSDLLGGPGLRVPTLVWRMDVSPRKPGEIRELVLVDARRGVVTLHFNQIADAKIRRVCDKSNVPNPDDACLAPFARAEGGAAIGIADVDLAYDFSGITYDFYRSRFGRDSIDNAGMPLLSTARYCPSALDCPFVNAYWNGLQMVYGDGFASADDVVGHELTHGVTEHESHLFYYYQSGAINESLSDVFGELIDLTDLRGTDTPATRWQMGEDLPASIGVIRDMSDPTLFGDPDRMTSFNYSGGGRDNGGVHFNSGVNNKAAFLMVDGGVFNGKTITGLGIDKTAAIYYEVQSNLLTSGSDYGDLYDALRQGCANLIGTRGITAANCQQVQKVVDATEMNRQPVTAGAAAPEAPVCPVGQVPSDRFYDDLENPTSRNWAASSAVGGVSWFYPQNTHPFTGFDATFATSGSFNFWGDDRDSIGDYSIARTAGVTLPSGAFLRFRHAHSFETGFDGGVVEYSTNGGTTWNDAGPLFVNNGYTHTLSTIASNPLGGRRAFSGVSHGYYSSRLNLSRLAGRSVRFRFRIGADSSVGGLGWFVDDVRVYTCGATGRAPVATVRASSFQARSALGAARVPVLVSWSATDPDGSGIARYELQRSQDGGAYSNVALPGPRIRSLRSFLLPAHAYQVRVRAVDAAGNLSPWKAGRTFTLSAVQDTSAAVSYSAGWTRATGAGFYGKNVTFSATVGRTATFTMPRGTRTVAWVSTRGPNRGRAEARIDGALAGTVDLFSSTQQARTIAFSKSGLNPAATHTLQVRVIAKNPSSTGNRVDVDAFTTMR